MVMIVANNPREKWLRGKRLAFWSGLALLFLISACKGPAPTPRAQGKICTWDVPPGETYRFEAVPPGITSVDFKARVYEASHDATCTNMEPGKHPLVIVAHGRVMAGVPDNYLGMTFITNHLASWGDIVVSVNLDVVNALQGEQTLWGIPHRGELIMHAVEYMLDENRKPSSRFYQRIDTTKIALVGHSRGGGAVIYAANYNSTHRNRAIKAIATMSPANFGTLPLQPAVPHICLYGTWDGDLYEGEGPDIWSRGTRQAPRELVQIYGANHYFFSDKATFAPENAEITRANHQLLANGLINAWLDRYMRDQDRFEWSHYLMGDLMLGKDLEYYISYQDNHYITIHKDSLLDQASLMVKSGRRGFKSEKLPKVCYQTDVMMNGAPDYCVGVALKAGWAARKEQLFFEFPPLDVSAFPVLSLRLTQVHGDSLNVIDRKKDFHIEVGDAHGKKAKALLSDYLGGLQYPDLSGSLPPDDPNNYKQIMRGFRIPKADLKGIDFTQVTSVRLVFDRLGGKEYDNRSGTIKVTDIEFSN